MKFAANSLPQTLVILLILPLRVLSLTRSLSMSSSSSSIKIPKRISIISAGFTAINGVYQQKSPSRIPAGFDRTCRAMKWDTVQLWNQLSDNKRPWYEAENESYVYWNRVDGKWWIDGPSGAGVYIVKHDGWVPPKNGWVALDLDYSPVPTVAAVEDL